MKSSLKKTETREEEECCCLRVGRKRTRLLRHHRRGDQDSEMGSDGEDEKKEKERERRKRLAVSPISKPLAGKKLTKKTLKVVKKGREGNKQTMPEACGSVAAAVVVVAKFMLRRVSLSALVSCAACLSGMYNKARHSLSNMLRGLVQRRPANS